MSEYTRQFVNHPGCSIRRAGRRTAANLTASLILIALALQLSQAIAQDQSEAGAREPTEAAPAAVDTANWACEYCAFEEGWYADITLGIGSVSDDSYKFGEYNGLQEEGSYLIGEASARYRGEEAAYLDIYASDLGLDTRSVEMEGGRQGSYAIFLRYDEIPHYISDSASTPYRGSGGDDLFLPSGWQAASTTSGMTELASSLREVDLKTERKRLGTGITVTTESPWSYDVELRHEDKEGNKPGGGAFLTSSAQLVEPVDYVTDEIDASVSYTSKRWQGRFAYYASVFSNSNESLTFDNAYTPAEDEGQLALPPDNEFHQFSLSLAYLVSARTQISGDIAIGNMTQDEELLRPTTSSPSSAAESADVEVDTTNARLKFVTSPTDRLSVSAAYSYDERDNKTPELIYEWVSTDIAPAPPRANLPYSYTRDSLKIKADYDYSRGIKLGAGYDIDERERTFQEVDETSEDTLWGTLRLRNIDRLFVEIKLATSNRDASTAEAVAAIDPPENVLMAKYNMADRERNSIGFFASYMPTPYYTIGVSVDRARDKYENSELGLTDSDDNSVNLDVTTLVSETVSLNAFVGRQKIESSQAGSQGFSTADWFATTEDTVENFGIGLNFVVIEDTMDAGIDFSVARSTGKIDLDNGGLASTFPDLRTDLETLRLYMAYRLNENLSLQAAYWHETYDASDWALDGVEEDTISNLLSFGLQDPDYSNDVVKLAMQYRF